MDKLDSEINPFREYFALNNKNIDDYPPLLLYAWHFCDELNMEREILEEKLTKVNGIIAMQDSHGYPCWNIDGYNASLKDEYYAYVASDGNTQLQAKKLLEAYAESEKATECEIMMASKNPKSIYADKFVIFKSMHEHLPISEKDLQQVWVLHFLPKAMRIWLEAISTAYNTIEGIRPQMDLIEEFDSLRNFYSYVNDDISLPPETLLQALSQAPGSNSSFMGIIGGYLANLMSLFKSSP